jgi:hypothetical protein
MGTLAHADKTLGVEWEFNPKVGVIGVSVVDEPDQFDGHKATVGGVNFRPDTITPQDGGQRIMCSTQASTEKYPLVSITHDMMWANRGDPFGAMTLEIVTGPIDYTRRDDWTAVSTFTTQFFNAVSAVCTRKALKTQRIEQGLPVMTTDTVPLCYAPVAAIVAEMNRVTPNIAQDNAAGQCEGGNPQKAENPKTVGIFMTHGFFSWNDITDVSVGNTQVNVGLDLATVGGTDLGPLFAEPDEIAGAAYKHMRSVVEELGGPPAVRGFRTLFAYSISVAVEASKRGSNYTPAMVANKNLYDLYPKSTLGEVYNQVKSPGVDPLENAAKLCVQEDMSACADETVKAWEKTIREGGNPIGVAKPIGPFGTEVVLEMRHHGHAVNQYMTLTRSWFGKELRLSDYDKMKQFFDRFFAVE